MHLAMCWIRAHNFSGNRHDCICSCKSNYHATTMPSRDLFGYLFWKICMTSLWEQPFIFEIFADNVPVFVSYHSSFFRTMFCNFVIFLYFFSDNIWFILVPSILLVLVIIAVIAVILCKPRSVFKLKLTRNVKEFNRISSNTKGFPVILS